jgi:hypothetical protein
MVNDAVGSFGATLGRQVGQEPLNMPRKPIELPTVVARRLRSSLARLPDVIRTLALAILAIGMLSAAAPARSQTYDPNYPVCLQSYGIGGGNIDCSYTSLPQCNASASGRAAQCLTNPFFTHPARKAVGGVGYR